MGHLRAVAPITDARGKAYTAAEKKKLLEEYLLAKAAGEGADYLICNRLGVTQTSLNRWKSILEAGGELADTQRGRPSMPRKAAPKPTNGNGHAETKQDDKLRIQLAVAEAQVERLKAQNKKLMQLVFDEDS